MRYFIVQLCTWLDILVKLVTVLNLSTVGIGQSNQISIISDYFHIIFLI